MNKFFAESCSLLRLSVTCLFASLSACAQLPPGMAQLEWVDLYGDRGSQVLTRDYVMCTELIEQRRSLLEGCMANRGWRIKEN